MYLHMCIYIRLYMRVCASFSLLQRRITQYDRAGFHICDGRTRRSLRIMVLYLVTQGFEPRLQSSSNC